MWTCTRKLGEEKSKHARLIQQEEGFCPSLEEDDDAEAGKRLAVDWLESLIAPGGLLSRTNLQS
jgi:hypothetical protein